MPHIVISAKAGIQNRFFDGPPPKRERPDIAMNSKDKRYHNYCALIRPGQCSDFKGWSHPTSGSGFLLQKVIKHQQFLA
jgi:hypothetical protein